MANLNYTLSLVVVVLAFVPTRSNAQDERTPRPAISGTVEDSSGGRVFGAEVRLEANGILLRTLVTTSEGSFSFSGVEDREYRVSVRRLGFIPVSRIVTPSAGYPSASLRIILARAFAKLDNVSIEAPESRLSDVNSRRHQGNFAHFISREEILKQNPMFASELLSRVPGASVRSSGRIGNVLRLRGCRPNIWIDGKSIRNAEIDEIVSPDDILGMEVYMSSSVVPAEYAEPFRSKCGTILVWTRMQ